MDHEGNPAYRESGSGPTVRRMSRTDRHGLLLCALAAAGFGAMAVLAKLAYAAGVSPLTLLAVRFALAGALLWPLAARGGAPIRPDRRAIAGGLALGGILYATEAGLFFASLTRLDASVAALLLYCYPALVVAGAVALRRERLTRRRAGALALSLLGVALVLVGGTGVAIDPLGAGLALGAAAGYTGYILLADGLGRRLGAARLAALVCAGAAVTFTLAGASTGQLDLALSAEAWGWIAAMALLSTVVPLVAFLAGMKRVGAGRASILSTLEPPVTVLLAFVAFGERLAPWQLAGGALVLAAVALTLPGRRRALRPLASRRHGAPARPAPRPTARPLGEGAT